MSQDKEVEKRYCHFIISCSDILDPPSQQDIVTSF
jgi:coatomer subunit beta